MEQPGPADRQHDPSATVTNVIIRVGALAVLVFWCFRILQPFFIPVLWGVIIAVAIYPLYQMLVNFLRGRRTLAATLVTVVLLAVLLVPTIMLTTLLVENAASLAQKIYQEHIVIPPPPASVQEWPLIGEYVASIWNLAANNLTDALKLVQPQLKAAGTWMLGMATSGGLSLIMFVFAFGIAGILLRFSEGASKIAHDLSERLAGERGGEFARLIEAAIRSVAQGVLGVAIIQTLLAGLGFIVVGLPGAGIWAFLCLISATVQIGVGPIVIPAVIYVFMTGDTTTAVIFLIWNALILVLDNVLKPLLLGRGVDVPMVVIFLGAIGGLLAFGIVGLFVGAIVLTLGYKLFQAWIAAKPAPPTGDVPN
jgi:predicted PurR-regulated permease PerM